MTFLKPYYLLRAFVMFVKRVCYVTLSYVTLRYVYVTLR